MQHPLAQAVLMTLLGIATVFAVFWMLPLLALEWLRAYSKTWRTGK
jgi:hypothetical protein